jgi:hypothetical protein
MLILLDSSMLVSMASMDLGDPMFGFPSPKRHRIQWFKPRSGLQPVLYFVYASLSSVVRPGTRIRLYGFLVPNVFCIPWHRLPESAAFRIRGRVSTVRRSRSGVMRVPCR